MAIHHDPKDLEKNSLTQVTVEPVTMDYKPEDAHDNVITHDAVFGDLHEDGPNYRGVRDDLYNDQIKFPFFIVDDTQLGNLGAMVIMTKTMIGLGILSIPFVFQAVGMIPGIIIVILVQTMMIWSNWVAGQTKAKHPEVWGVSDVGRLMAGRVGEEVLGISFCLYMTFIASAGIVGITTALNAVTLHATCTVVFMVASALLGFILMSVRTLDTMSWLGWVGLMSILAAIFTMVIAVGLQDRPAAAPQTGPWDKDFKLFNSPTFAEAMGGVSSVIFSTAATPAFFAIRAEMRDPQYYTRCMLAANTFTTVLLVVVGSVVYWYCGQYVAVPAPGSAGPLFKRICYGLAIPGLAVTLCIYAHMPAKWIFVRLLRGTEHISKSTKRHWITWFACTGGVTLVSYLLASAIPIFSSLVSFVGALFAPTVSLIPMGCVWLYDNWRNNPNRTIKLRLQAAWAVWIVLAGVFITVAGTYGAVVGLISQGSEGRPWSCADNS